MDELLEAAPAGFLSFDDDGIILVTNRRMTERLGYQPGELEGRHIETILSAGGRIFYHTHFFPLLKMQGSADEVYFSLRSKEGEEVPVLTNAARRISGGKAFNDCVFVRMSVRHQYEDELLRARKAADQASASKARFLSMMSHDLRTPLAAITGYADLLMTEMRGPITEEQREDLRAIKSAGQDMMRLISDILSFAQLESGRVEVRMQPVRLEDVLARAESLMRVRFQEKSLAYDRTACPVDFTIAADPDRLQQILLNLLTNAVKFTPPGGEIHVRCTREEGRTLIHVEDTGVGIPEHRVAEVFEPFVQLQHGSAPAGESGVGLGLSISRDLARAMGGDLTVTSVEGKGSVFTIALPNA